MRNRANNETAEEPEINNTKEQYVTYAPDYDYWARQDLWRLDVAAALITGIEPESLDKCTTTILNKYKEFLSTAITSERAEALEVTIPTWSGENIIHEYGSVHPKTIVKFAIEKGFNVPASLTRTMAIYAEHENCLQSAQPYLDKSHKYYSKDLEIAINAWMELLFNEDNLSDKKGLKDQIHEWLSKEHTDLSDAAKERIATLINPNKKGGAPRTQK